MLKFDLMEYEFLMYDMVGLVERLERIVSFIDVVDVEEYVDELMLYSLTFNVDIYIGVE